MEFDIVEKLLGLTLLGTEWVLWVLIFSSIVSVTVMIERFAFFNKMKLDFPHALTPERILDAVEASTGLRCTGRTMALNSMENRVYEIEIELDEKPKNPADAFVIAKFYRPGRWSLEQIQQSIHFCLTWRERFAGK